MGNSTEYGWRNQLIFYTIIGMLVSLLISRAALSITMMLFVAICLVHKNIIPQLKAFSKDYLLIAITLLFFVPFVSGLWSNDLHQWSNVTQVKLPFLFFPIAFAGTWRLTKNQWVQIAVVFLGVVLMGCAWSLAQYITDYQSVNAQYLKAKTLPTLLQNDHVRFSLLVSLAIVLSCLLIEIFKLKWQKTIIISAILFFVVYLHILSARTGLFSFYIFLLLYIVWLIWRRRKLIFSFVLVFILVVLPLLAWLTVPTFQNRIKYFVYDFSHVKKATYLPGSNDGARTISIKAGWHVLDNNPLGVGAGDVMMEMEKWYAAYIPKMLVTDKFYPCNEWLMYGAFAGWPGVAFFTLAMLVPFFLKNLRFRIFWIAFNIISAASFVFDMGLEVQYGIFIYTFILLWWRKWFQSI